MLSFVAVMHRGGSLCCRASTTTIAGELNLSNIVKMVENRQICVPSNGRAAGRTFFVKFYVFFKNLTKLLIPDDLPLREYKINDLPNFDNVWQIRDPRYGLSIDARHA